VTARRILVGILVGVLVGVLVVALAAGLLGLHRLAVEACELRDAGASVGLVTGAEVGLLFGAVAWAVAALVFGLGLWDALRRKSRREESL